MAEPLKRTITVRMEDDGTFTHDGAPDFAVEKPAIGGLTVSKYRVEAADVTLVIERVSYECYTFSMPADPRFAGLIPEAQGTD